MNKHFHGWRGCFVFYPSVPYQEKISSQIVVAFLEHFFETGSTAGIQAKHAVKLRIQLTALNMAKRPDDMSVCT